MYTNVYMHIFRHASRHVIRVTENCIYPMRLSKLAQIWQIYSVYVLFPATLHMMH